MAAVTKLEDLEIWQLSFELAQRIYDVTEKGDFAKDFAMRDQARRASLSCMANVSEGFARASPKEFARFLDISRGSAVELQSIMHLARARGYLTEHEFDEIHGGYGLLCRRTNALIRYLKAKSA